MWIQVTIGTKALGRERFTDWDQCLAWGTELVERDEFTWQMVQWWRVTVEISGYELSMREFLKIFWGTPRESDTASRREEACLLNPCKCCCTVWSQPGTTDILPVHRRLEFKLDRRNNSHPWAHPFLHRFLLQFKILWYVCFIELWCLFHKDCECLFRKTVKCLNTVKTNVKNGYEKRVRWITVSHQGESRYEVKMVRYTFIQIAKKKKLIQKHFDPLSSKTISSKTEDNFITTLSSKMVSSNDTSIQRPLSSQTQNTEPQTPKHLNPKPKLPTFNRPSCEASRWRPVETRKAGISRVCVKASRFFWMKPLLVENVIGWKCHWMRNSLDEKVLGWMFIGWNCVWMKVSKLDESFLDESVSGWKRFWMKVSLDENAFGWKCQWKKSFFGWKCILPVKITQMGLKTECEHQWPSTALHNMVTHKHYHWECAWVCALSHFFLDHSYWLAASWVLHPSMCALVVSLTRLTPLSTSSPSSCPSSTASGALLEGWETCASPPTTGVRAPTTVLYHLTGVSPMAMTSTSSRTHQSPFSFMIPAADQGRGWPDTRQDAHWSVPRTSQLLRTRRACRSVSCRRL